MTYTLGFIGGGNMAEAIIRAAIEHQLIPANQIAVADPHEHRRALFASMGAHATADNAEIVAASEQIVIAVKPQVFEQIASELAERLSTSQVLISVMAGIGSAKIARAIQQAGDADAWQTLRIVRVMPNTPVLVGQGMAGIALGEHAHPGDDALAMRLFQAAGKAVRVDEAQLDALTAVSGSGPAYAFYLAEAMVEAAGQMGLDEHALELVVQTIKGAAHLMEQSDDPPAELRRKVMSPGGTTEAAIHHLDAQNARQHIIDAMHAAQNRSEVLGRQ